MKATRLPILLCHANCPKCRLPTELKIFESGVAGDFATFVGRRSGTIYRLDLGKVHYQNFSEVDLLTEATQKEEGLIRLPDEVRCKICGTVFAAVNMPIDGEEVVDAYEL